MEQLAERASRSWRFVQKLEQGLGHGSTATWEQLAQGLGVPLHELFIEDPRQRRGGNTGAREAEWRYGALDAKVEALVMYARTLDAKTIDALIVILGDLAALRAKP